MTSLNASGGQVDTIQSAAGTPKVTNLPIPVSGSPGEVSHLFVTGTKRFTFHARGKAKIQFAFVTGESGTKFITLFPGDSISEQDLSLSSLTLYVQSDTAGETLEILEWS